MITALLEQAESQGVVPLRRPWRFNARIRLNRILVDVFDASDRYYHLRVVEAYDATGEFQVFTQVHACLGRRTPTPRGLVQAGTATGLVFDGVRSRYWLPRDWWRARAGDDESRQLVEFLGEMKRKCGPSGNCGGLDEWMVALRSRHWFPAEEELVAQVIARHLPRAAVEVDANAQHGDLVVNNLAFVGADLIAFDWEDYAKVKLSGFDLSVLLASAADFDGPRLLALRSAPQGRVRPAVGPGWLEPACTAIGLSLDEFWRCLPFHLLVFLVLKDQYSPAIGRRVFGAILSLVSGK